jgi:tetratricopeptide (TPR) repeat protein
MSRILSAAAATLLILSIGVQVIRDRGWQPYEPANPLLWVRTELPVKRLMLGYGNIAADLYWMRAVVYYGGKRRSSEEGRNFDLLGPLLDLVTTLDTRFKVAYRFGAIFLTEAYPSGPGKPDLAIALLQRAIQANPGVWEYPHDVGFIYYWWLRDYKTAAEWFDRAGDLPGAADWLKPLAATTLAQGGDRASSRLLWNKILENNDVAWLRDSATRRLTQLDAMDQIDALNQIVDRFTARQGHPPRSWQELIEGERLRGLPLDPSGVPYALDPATGRIEMARKSSLWPLPAETPRVGLPGQPPS